MSDNSHVQAARLEAAGLESTAAGMRACWSVVYGLKPQRDGDKWFVLLGDDIQAGIVGFGKTPTEAIYAFDRAMANSSGSCDYEDWLRRRSSPLSEEVS